MAAMWPPGHVGREALPAAFPTRGKGFKQLAADNGRGDCMDEYLKRRVSNATLWSRRLAIFSAVLFLTAVVGHRFGYLSTPDMLPVFGTVVFFIAVALLFVVRALFLFWHHGGRGGGTLVFAVLILLLVLAPFGITGYRAITLPMLNDVSTDMDDPPELAIAAPLRVVGMNVIEPFTPERRKLQEDAYPEVTGRRYEAPIVQVAEVVQDLLDGRGWTIVGQENLPADATEISIEAQASSPLLRFPADVVVRLIDEDTSTYVDMRSASRYGPHDFGDNAARVESFLAELDVEIAYLTVVAPVQPSEPATPAPPPVPEPKEPVFEEPAVPLDRSEDPPD